MSRFGTVGRVRLRIAARFAEYGDCGAELVSSIKTESSGGPTGPKISPSGLSCSSGTAPLEREP